MVSEDNQLRLTHSFPGHIGERLIKLSPEILGKCMSRKIKSTEILFRKFMAERASLNIPQSSRPSVSEMYFFNKRCAGG